MSRFVSTSVLRADGCSWCERGSLPVNEGAGTPRSHSAMANGASTPVRPWTTHIHFTRSRLAVARARSTGDPSNPHCRDHDGDAMHAIGRHFLGDSLDEIHQAHQDAAVFQTIVLPDALAPSLCRTNAGALQRRRRCRRIMPPACAKSDGPRPCRRPGHVPDQLAAFYARTVLLTPATSVILSRVTDASDDGALDLSELIPTALRRAGVSAVYLRGEDFDTPISVAPAEVCALPLASLFLGSRFSFRAADAFRRVGDFGPSVVTQTAHRPATSHELIGVFGRPQCPRRVASVAARLQPPRLRSRS